MVGAGNLAGLVLVAIDKAGEIYAGAAGCYRNHDAAEAAVQKAFDVIYPRRTRHSRRRAALVMNDT